MGSEGRDGVGEDCAALVRAESIPLPVVLIIAEHNILNNQGQDIEDVQIRKGCRPHKEGQRLAGEEVEEVQVKEVSQSPPLEYPKQSIDSPGHEGMAELQLAHETGYDGHSRCDGEGHRECGAGRQDHCVSIDAVGAIGLIARWTIP